MPDPMNAIVLIKHLSILPLIILALITPAHGGSVVLAQSPLYKAERQGRFVILSLEKPHQVLSTSKVNGGMHTGISYLVNHQSMEAKNHQDKMELVLNSSDIDYHGQIAKRLSLNSEQMVLMGTAANMSHLAHHRQQFKSLTVDAFITAGVSGNAMRAGDPTRWFETPSGNRKVDMAGTINIMVVVNQPLSAGALTKASVIITEAKSAALGELAVPSGYSSHLATGTGTDQFIIASPLATKNEFVHSSASGHLKLGELLANAVKSATLEALKWQNRLQPNDTASVIHALQRFGLTEAKLMAHLKTKLPKSLYFTANSNRAALINHPRLVAAAYAYAQLLDRFQYGSLPQSAKAETLNDNAATAAVALSSHLLDWDEAWRRLSKQPQSNDIEPFLDAIALGWQSKWQD